MEINTRIKIARGHLSQEEFAEKVGVTRAAVAQWERKSSPTIPRMPKLKKIAEVTGCSFEWLLTGTGEPHITELADFPPQKFYSRGALIETIRELSDKGILAPNDDGDSVVLAFLAIVEDHERKLQGQVIDKDPIDVLRADNRLAG